MTVCRRTTLIISAMDLWSPTRSMCECATQQHPKICWMHLFYNNIMLTLDCCLPGLSLEPLTSKANTQTLSTRSMSKLQVFIFIHVLLHTKKGKHNLYNPLCCFCVMLYILCPLPLSVADGLLTREEQIILGVLLSFFLAVLLIIIICGSVKYDGNRN